MSSPQQRFKTVDAFSSLVVMLVKTIPEPATPSGASNKVTLLNRVLAITVLVMFEVFQHMKHQFPQKVVISRSPPPPFSLRFYKFV